MLSLSLQTSKCCSTCKEDKAVSEFHKRRDRPDGLQSSCKLCQTNAQRRNKPLTEAKTTTMAFVDVELTLEQKKSIYNRAILNLFSQGIASEKFCKEALERINN